MLRFTFVVARYGLDVLGGAEKHARDVAERLAQAGHDVRVLTTCSKSYVTWANELEEGTSRLNGVEVVRHRTSIRRLRPLDEITKAFASAASGSETAAKAWAIAQGPVCPGLLDRLGREASERDLLVFFSLLSWLTFEGISRFGEKSALVPVVHEEPPIYTVLARRTLGRARALLVNTEEEASRIARVTHAAIPPMGIVAVGGDEPPPNDRSFIPPSTGPFLVILGRLAKAKPMLAVWREMVRIDDLPPLEIDGKMTRWSDARLVTVGERSPAYASLPNVVPLDFVDESTRWQILRRAVALVNPSLYESLSLVLMEAWRCDVPVVVNERCDVTVGQCRRSRGGIAIDFAHPASGARQLADGLASESSRRRMGENGHGYVRARYDWHRVLEAYERVAASVRDGGSVAKALEPWATAETEATTRG